MTRRLSRQETSRSAAAPSRRGCPVIDTDVRVTDYPPALAPCGGSALAEQGVISADDFRAGTAVAHTLGQR